MIGPRFDALARGFASISSRRGVVGGILGLVAASVTGRDSSAQSRRICRPLGAVCLRSRRGLRCCPGTRCVDGRCRCPRGKRRCRGRCIGRHRCCTNKHCPGNQVCRNGTCACRRGQQRCGKRCVPAGQCCKDCRPNQVCHNGACCTPKTEALACSGACGAVSDGCRGTVVCPGCPPCQECVGGVCQAVPNRTTCANGGICCNGVCCDGCCGADGTCGACIVFATDDEFTGNFSGSPGLAGANSRCQESSALANLPGTYAAWISDESDESAPVNRFRHSGRPYVLVGGTVVADNWDDLVSADDLNHEINLNEFGAVSSGGSYTLTNTNPDGSRFGGLDSCCQGWTSDYWEDNYQRGRTTDRSSTWTDFTEISCVSLGRLYCFQQE